MRILVACACALVAASACGDAPGRYVIVDVGTTGADHVVLYLGASPCSDTQGQPCDRIAPELAQGIARPLPVNGGGAWFRDADVKFDEAVHGTTAHFRIVASDTDQVIQIVAVGFAGQKPVAVSVLHDVHVRKDQADSLETTLEATPLVTASEETAPQHPDGRFVLVWNSTMPASPSDCVLVEAWSGGTASRTFVVPPDDADCDGFPTYGADGTTRNPAECNELWYDFSGTAHLQDSDCATPGHVGTFPDPVCLLGGQACVDGVGLTNNTACAPVMPSVCMPSSLCTSACAARQDVPPPLSSCVTTAVGQDQPTARIVCSVAEQDVGGSCPGTTTLTNPMGGTVDVGQLFPAMPCQDVQFSATDSLKALAPQGELDLMAPDTLRLQVQDLNQNANQGQQCRFDVEWTDGTLTSANAFAIGLFKAQNGNTLLVPIELQRVSCLDVPSTITDGITCTLTTTSNAGANDSIVNCAR